MGYNPWGRRVRHNSTCTHAPREKETATVTVSNFNTSLSTMNKSLRQKVSKEIVDLNNTIYQ